MEPIGRSYSVIRATWLTRKPHPRAWFIATWSVIFLIICSILFWQNYFFASQWMTSSKQEVFYNGQLWRLWTSLFAHADLAHLASNSLLFFIFGYFLSGYFGLFVFPFLAILLGGLTNALTVATYAPDMKLIGISGVVYWMGGMWLVLYLLLDIQRTVLQRALRSIGVALAVFFPSTAFDPQISYKAHFIGFFLGIVSAIIYHRLNAAKFKAAVRTELVIEPEEETRTH
ncbi:rhomboid family intramembrane serine protease [Bdellovibrio reynosensis]|uniref:Rhomboid family intramembrane serine protease n=1 Tax=Bdellovibrio reynosensis TaxID=2835041 RepID=A0ABY4C8A2_9BACT|nr:rhomboid family intramembrane serine protease [Bdellovibrio reynosensis]UOF00954.1 rhomboid family intramembrane serine protease [Bdellovibrio reynosensis]